MDLETLRRLCLLNQLSLTDSEKEGVIGFFSERDADTKTLDDIDTSSVERMVHVLPVLTVVREDEVNQPFTREQLQSLAPDTDEGYWCVPRVIE